MRGLLAALGLLLASSASAQTLSPFRAVASVSAGTATDSEVGMIAFQLTGGVQAGMASARVRGTAASSFGLLGSRDRSEVAALGGVTLGRRARVFIGAGAGSLSGATRGSRTPGLALALDVMLPTSDVVRFGIQAWATVSRQQSLVGIGFAVGLDG